MPLHCWVPSMALLCQWMETGYIYYVLQYERGHGSFWARRQNKSMMIAIIAVVAWRGCMLARTRREVKFLERWKYCMISLRQLSCGHVQTHQDCTHKICSFPCISNLPNKTKTVEKKNLGANQNSLNSMNHF